MKEIDKHTQDVFGTPSLILMKNAGGGTAKTPLDMIKDSDSKKVICVCSRGNNGKDGFACARHLINNGVDVEV